MWVYNYFNLSVKTVKNFFTDISPLFPEHKITLLMQCVESITDILFPSIFLIADTESLNFLITMM
jgi:hypothetical protein